VKLNNRGWGLSAFLGFVVVFLIFLFMAGVNAYKVGLEKDKPKLPVPSIVSKEKYQQLEEKIVVASAKYKNVYYQNLLEGDYVFVNFNTLIRSELLSSSEGCSGYVKISHSEKDNYQYSVYFHCPDYVSSGYNEELDG